MKPKANLRFLPPEASADLILLGGNIITVDPQKPRASAVAIKGDRFLYVGTEEEAWSLAGRNTRAISLKGRTVLPGFIDSHQHLSHFGTNLLQIDCSPMRCKTIAHIQEAVRKKAAGKGPGEWIRGVGYDDTKVRDSRVLSRRDLDEAAPEHPVFIQHVSGHWAVVNSRALEKGGVAEDAADPPGGVYGREPGTGRLNGILYEQAEFAFVFEGTTGKPPIMPSFTLKERVKGMRMACDLYLASGITSVNDALVSAESLETYQAALRSGDCKVRVYMLMAFDYLPQLEQLNLRTGFGNERLRVGGIKILADGAIAGRTAYLSEPYIGTEDRGILAVESEAVLHEQIRRGHQAGFQVCVHANGDQVIDMTLAGFEKALAALPRKDHRHRLEHCTVVNEEILKRIRKLKMLVTPFGSYIHHHGEKMIPAYGEKRVAMMFAHRSFLDFGIAVSGASDHPCGPYEPLLAIQSCVTRKSAGGESLGAGQRISVEEAIRLYTQASAYASFEEDLKGSITPGKLADLVILGEDPRRVDADEIKDVPVETTIVGGQVKYGRLD
ncbi:MAG TPA: amidohydrolase [Thermodesulfobacteriota bacterium]|nr:amidohydrolase [Thermodesulfobacteriota bacterium]